MPYIKMEDRENLFDGIEGVIFKGMTAGELNYVFTMLAHQFVKLNGRRYQTMNDVMGVFEGAKLEFYRRVVAPYENEKILENGDV